MAYRPGRRSVVALVGVLLTVLILVNSWPVVSVDAQGGEQDYTGVDIVFVVDQSGSMGGLEYGNEYHPLANDPNDLRFSGLQQMVERLAGYRLNYFHDSEVQFQIAVVYFGSHTETIVEPTIVAPDTFDEWQPLSGQLQSVLSADAFQRNLESTDHLLALQEAKRILQEMELTWQSGQHIQVVMMLTDGEWAVVCPEPEEEAPAYCQNGEFQGYLYRQTLAEYVRTELPCLRYRLFLAAINDRTVEYWSRVQSYWEELTDNHAQLMDANTMWALFEGILADLTVNEPGLADKKTTRGEVVEIPETQDRIAVPPYLQEITFIIHKPAPEVRVKMYQEEDLLEDLVTATVAGEDQYIESITIRDPKPGYITVERPVTTGILRIFMSQIGADVSCDPLSAVAQFIPVRLQCTLNGRDGPLPPYSDPRFQLMVEVEIRGEGASQRLELAHQGQSMYTAYYLPTQPGEHTFNIAASTQKPDGTPFELFRRPPTGMASFMVEPTEACLRVGGSPTALLPVSVSVTLVDASGAALTVSPESVGFVQMHLTLTMADQQTSVDLTPDAMGFQGSCALYPGSYRVHLEGLVTDPATGQPFTAFDESLGSLEVLPPRIVWQGFSSPWPQYHPASVDFFLADQSDNPIGDQLGAAWHLEAQLEVKSGEQTKPVDLAVKERGHWAGEVTFYEGGDFVLLVSAWAENQAGDKVTLLKEQPVMPFTVRPMTLVRTAVLRPEPESQHAWRDLFWRPRRLEIEVAIQDEAGDPLAPDQILERPADVPLVVELVSPEGESSGPLPLTRGSAPGRYLTVYEDYEPFDWYAHRDLGRYDVRVRPAGDLRETYTYEKPSGVTARVHLNRHSLWWMLPAIFGLLLAILLVVAVRQVCLHLWSIEGTLSIEVEGAGLPWTRRLRDYGKHTLTFTQRDGIPAKLRKVTVHQRRGPGSPPIEAVVQLKQGIKRPLRMVDGARKPLGMGVAIGYQRGMGAAAGVKASLSFAVLAYGLAALLMLAGVGGIIFAVITSLS